jgi:hypothetical protein
MDNRQAKEFCSWTRWTSSGPRGTLHTLIPDPTFNIRDNSRKGAIVVITQDKRDATTFQVLDVNPAEKHLVLMTRKGGEKHRMLVGFDEREYFIAGIPESSPITTVKDAKAALKPDSVRSAEKHGRIRRQGEWFFIPASGVVIKDELVLHHEPLSRGRGSKPHMCQDLYREGGELVYVSRGARLILTSPECERLNDKEREANQPWTTNVRDPLVFVRGTVKHSDHGTLNLRDWHRVEMNTENKSMLMMKSIAFLD